MLTKQVSVNAYDCVRITLASPEVIRSWSHGEVTKPETINYRNLKPERDGLFCARIFGPVNDWECLCGKYKRQKFKGVVCDKCGVEVASKAVRRERMGHIALVSPVSHVWFFKGVPSRIGYLLDIPLKDLERVLYFEAYVVTDPGDTPLRTREIMAEDKYREFKLEFGDRFRAQMGAEGIKELLKHVDVEALAIELRVAMKAETSTQKRAKISKRLKVAEGFRHSGNKPEWMILDVIPVLPPELRPLVPLGGGRFATSDLNDLYRRVINRNNRTRKLLELRAPEVIVRNEKRMLQEGVDALFENGKRGRLLRGVSNRPLKSLSDALKGKQGRFRQNLLGKRVDYSGRSVIVVGPDLKLHQCGLPRKMALELFKPFIFNYLEHKGYAATIRQAKEMIEQGEPVVWDALDEVIQSHPVLLNRAPTLHRLGIQAFQPVLVEDKAIHLHPLVCAAFNADFDGDQMAVHVPLSPMAQIEAKVLMMSTQNLLNPANGRPCMVPSQDIVLGVYYLTRKRSGRKGEGMVFGSLDEAIAAHAAGVVDTHAIIQLRFTGEVVDTEAWHRRDPRHRSEQDVSGCPACPVSRELIVTTAGRVIFNHALPEGLPFINGLLKKEGQVALVDRACKLYGQEVTVRLLDAMKDLGFLWATKAGVSVGIDDLVVPSSKPDLLEAAHREVRAIEREFHHEGLLDAATRTNRILDVWGRTSEQVASAMMEELKKRDETGPFLNSIYITADSGARGSMAQIRQVAGMRGLMARPSGDIIETPVTASFKEGLPALQYFTSTHGARKGMIDVNLKTADVGYLTRKLVDVAQDVIVCADDCGTTDGIEVRAAAGGGTDRIPLRDRIVGRVLLEDVVDPHSGAVIASRGALLTEASALRIEAAGIAGVRIRSVLTCEARRGVCATCYGTDPAGGRLVVLGTAVGILAAQSIGQPATQLSLGARKDGGLARHAVPPGECLAPFPGTVRFEGLEQGVVRDPDGGRWVARRNGKVYVANPDDERERGFPVPRGARLRVEPGDQVQPGDTLATWDPLRETLIAEAEGRVELVQQIPTVNGSTLRIPLEHRRGRAIRAADAGRGAHLLVLRDLRRDREVASCRLETGMILQVQGGDVVQPGQILATHPAPVFRHLGIQGGLRRVVELFEARSPARQAILARHGGVVSLRRLAASGWRLEIDGEEDGDSFILPFGTRILVKDRERIEKGQALTDGAFNPKSHMEVFGEIAAQARLVEAIQAVYLDQRLEVPGKHIEVIVRQMGRRVLVTDAGDTPLIVDTMVDKHRFKELNAQALRDGGCPASCEPRLVGITKAALTSESFISAASFQETTRVLTEAALEGRVDYLRGLKENVILGRLIPAGTGMPNHRNLEIEESQYPEAVDSESLGIDDFDDEYSRIAHHVEELQGMSEVEGDEI